MTALETYNWAVDNWYNGCLTASEMMCRVVTTDGITDEILDTRPEAAAEIRKQFAAYQPA